MISNTIKIKGIDFLILDENINDNAIFILALNTGIKSAFNDERYTLKNNYMNSLLRGEIDKWFNQVNIKAVASRKLDLLTLDGYKNFGQPAVEVAPLTLDEYRKYSDIIKSHIKNSFWLTTGYGRPNSGSSTSVCCVYRDGLVGSNHYSYSHSLAPALWISKDDMLFDLSFVSTEDLMTELSKRLNK